MPGIYLHHHPEGLTPADVESFERRFTERIAHRPAEQVDQIKTTHLRATVINHGRWPGPGVAQNDHGRLLLCGSCWFDGESISLSSAAQALPEYQRRKQEGTDEPLRGLHALAYMDAAGAILELQTDRFGTVPLYYRPDGRGGLLVASELKFLVNPGQDRPDLDGLADLLSIGYHVRRATLVSGITRLPLHHRLRHDREGLETWRLPQPGYPRDIPLDDDALQEIDRRAALHFNRFAEHTKGMSIALSGGLDSRLLLYSARQQGIPLTGFTSGEAGNVDVSQAIRLADHLGIPIIDHQVDERGFPDWFEQAAWISEGRTPANHVHYFPSLFSGETPGQPQIHGLIGEAVLGGYLEHDRYLDTSPDARRQGCHAFARDCWLYWPEDLRRRSLSADLARRASTAHTEAADQLLASLGFRGSYSDYLDFRFIYRGGLFGVPAFTSQVLPWADIVTPFLDADFYDFGARLRSHDIRDRVVQLKWGLACMPGFADLPRVKDGLLLPVRDDDPAAYARAMKKQRINDRFHYLATRLSRGRFNAPRPKGFPHYGQWYRRHRTMRDFVDGIMLDERTAERGLWQRDGLVELLRHLRHGHNVWPAVGAVLMIEVLCRQFIDGDFPEFRDLPEPADSTT